MASITHVFSHCISALEVLGFLVFAGDAHVADLYLLLKVLNESFCIFAEFPLGNKETMSFLHMFLVLLKVSTYFLAKEALLVIFLKGSWQFDLFFLDLDDESWVVSLRSDMLIESLMGGEGFSEINKDVPALVALELRL
jgi:hypothetical protein